MREADILGGLLLLPVQKISKEDIVFTANVFIIEKNRNNEDNKVLLKVQTRKKVFGVWSRTIIGLKGMAVAVIRDIIEIGFGNAEGFGLANDSDFCRFRQTGTAS